MNNKPFIELPTLQGTEFINPEDIIAIKADDKHVNIITEEQTGKLIRLSIGNAEKKLAFPFLIRCHRSYIVNVLKIKGRNKNGLLLKLPNEINIPVSRSYKKSFEQELKKYCKKLVR
jgi:DNA-binding LytR/AlgR family response regulator